MVVTPESNQAISRLFQYLGRHYVRYFNFNYSRSGTLFEGRFKSSVIQEDRYLLECLRYIELNPVRAGMVKDPGDYHWSSYHTHAFGVSSALWTPHPMYLALASGAADRQIRYRGLVSEVLEQSVLAKIRHCADTGLVLGTEDFRQQIAKLVT